jgi:endonuclease V-like protein UPF0215 family
LVSGWVWQKLWNFLIKSLKRGIDPSTAAKVIYGIALTNGIPEAVAAVLIATPVTLAIKRVLNR